MATALAKKMTMDQLQDQRPFSGIQGQSTCSRCGGLLVTDYCLDLLNSSGELECPAKRCVQCGEVVDSIIQLNRQLRFDSMTVAQAGPGAHHE